jgi:thiamine-phosphate pyrophosphorylase
VNAATLPPQPWVCLVTDHALCADGVIGLERAIMGALDSGVNLIQLREPTLPARELYELGLRLRRLTTEAGAALLVNDRIDVALAINADGVHLGEHSLPVAVARELVGGALVSTSVHGQPRAIQAQADGADLLVLGTIFSTASHLGLSPAGPQLIRKVRAQVKLPIVAIGGITPDNAAQPIADGASGVAVIRSILADARPQQAARRLVEAVREAWPTAALHRKL